MRITDSRRLTGANLLLDGPGAVLDVALHGLDPEPAITRWRQEAGRLLDAVGWGDSTLATRLHAQGASLAFTAPIDALYSATEVNEAAWHAVVAALGGDERLGDERGHGHGDTVLDLDADGDDGGPAFETVVERLRAQITAESNPKLIALAQAAQARGVTLLCDDRRVSLGLGIRSRSWPVGVLPKSPEAVRWKGLGEIPVALVTGTNGKSTTVRLLGAIARAAGMIAGVTSTDRVTVGDEVVAEGDFSGPNGARSVLRDRRVEIAALELARGGLLRRGLALPRADVAVVTNVTNDHLGEFGIFDLPSMADAKLIVAKAIGPKGRVVLNADDPLLLERGLSRAGLHGESQDDPRARGALAPPVVWFTLDAAHPDVGRHIARGGEACVLDGDRLMLIGGGDRSVIARTSEVPIAFGGTARYNIANALAAIGAASSLGLAPEAIRLGLTRFGTSPAENPGRANRWDLGGIAVIVDYAHNPQGLAAISEVTTGIPARRRGLVIGQAGDRDDAAIREFARTAWSTTPDRVFIKEMESFLRGRDRGVVPALIEAELRSAGAAPESLERHPSEMDAVRAALAWARSGDVLLLTTHADRDEVIALLERLAERSWKPGEDVPT